MREVNVSILVRIPPAYEVDCIAALSNNGRHLLSSGRIGKALTDERLSVGDQVIIVEDTRGTWNIVAGRK